MYAQAYKRYPGETTMSSVEENMRLMQTLDDAWNSQDLCNV
jgi:hypothetical protein